MTRSPCLAAVQVDIYSIGVVLWEISTRELPIRGKLRPLQVPQDCSMPMVQLINACLSPNANSRPTAEQIFHLIKDMHFEASDVVPRRETP